MSKNKQRLQSAFAEGRNDARKLNPPWRKHPLMKAYLGGYKSGVSATAKAILRKSQAAEANPDPDAKETLLLEAERLSKRLSKLREMLEPRLPKRKTTPQPETADAEG